MGKFGSAEEAARAHDRASLLASGLQAATNYALPDVFAASLAACARAVAAPGQQYRGVINRGGNWLALLDVGALRPRLASLQVWGRSCSYCCAKACPPGVRAQAEHPRLASYWCMQGLPADPGLPCPAPPLAAGSPYELGPYPSEVAAAQAYDRYSMLLHGVKAQVRLAISRLEA